MHTGHFNMGEGYLNMSTLFFLQQYAIYIYHITPVKKTY